MQASKEENVYITAGIEHDTDEVDVFHKEVGIRFIRT
jgi:hypothetical protein